MFHKRVIYYSLMKHNALTIRCSSILFNDKLYLFLGRSGSGKSTIIKTMSIALKFSQPLSDDHIVINDEDNCLVSAVTPIWDEINLIKKSGKNIETKNMILYFLEDLVDDVSLITDPFVKVSLLVKHCILFSYSYEVTGKILEIAHKIVSKYKFFTCPVQHFKKIVNHISCYE